MPSLTRLILSNNQLHDVDLEFECMEKLQFLDVSYNKIKRLDKHTLTRIENWFVQPPESWRKTPNTTRKINMVNNPYLCDCNLRDMYNWLRDTRANLYSREEMRCYTGIPELNAGRRILNVETLRCAGQDEHAAHAATDPSQHVGSGITHTLLIILIILVICLLATLLYLNKEHVHNNVKPLIDNFQKSLQYRTIEKDLTESQIHPPEVNV